MPRKGRTGAERKCHLVTVEPWYNDCVAGLHQCARLPAEIRVQEDTDAAGQRAFQWQAKPGKQSRAQSTDTPNKTSHKSPSKVTSDLHIT